MTDLSRPITTWTCQGPSYIIEINVNSVSVPFENMLRMFRYRYSSPIKEKNGYRLNIRGPDVLIMNDPDRMISAYKKNYDGYNVRSIDGTMEFMFTYESSENSGNSAEEFTSISDISALREWIIDENGYLFGCIQNREDMQEYDWNVPDGLKPNETGIGSQHGSFAVIEFRTISRNGITPCFVSFRNRDIYTEVAHRIYSEKISNTPPNRTTTVKNSHHK